MRCRATRRLSNDLPRSGVLSFVAHTQASAAKFLDDTVVGDNGVDHSEDARFWTLHLTNAAAVSQRGGAIEVYKSTKGSMMSASEAFENVDATRGH